MPHRDPILKATEIQRAAADPTESVVLRASAGSGKTKVLIDRFVRLCVQDGAAVHPRSILAITFTRKAATEIQDRLLRKARRLATVDAPAREAILTELFGRRPTSAESERAARLYERLLENLSGLQVGTLHAFCQRILSRFAAEAGLDPRARLLEDRDELIDEALDRVQNEAADDPQLTAWAQRISPSPAGVRKALRQVFHQQMRLERWLRRVAARADRPLEPRVELAPLLLAELKAWLCRVDPPAGDPDRMFLLAAVAEAVDEFVGIGLPTVAGALDRDEHKRLAKSLEALQKAGEKAQRSLTDASIDLSRFDAAVRDARTVLLTTTGSVRRLTRIHDEDLKTQFQALVLEQGAALLTTLRFLSLSELYARNQAQLHLGLRSLDVYSELKRRDGVIDFGDLEDLACRLMGDEARALSLLQRLDDSIRHILLDEFQDTNWNQLEILEPFIDEFTAGGGEGSPTVFVVGDLKQSIYAFRGAEPGVFAQLSEAFAQRGHRNYVLPTNFRSLPAVVDGVGALFLTEPLVSCLPAGEVDHVHQAVARTAESGRLVLIEAYDDADDERSGKQVAADATARLVRQIVDGGTEIWGEADGPPVRTPATWNDILILMRSRTDASLYEQALRRAGVPCEPAGRGMLAASREVQDVLALLRWLVWTEDDVALAAVLRSPLFRWPESLFQSVLGDRDLHRRHESGRYRTPRGLWTTLRAKRGDDPRLAAAVDLLKAWRRDVGFVDPHELLRRIYREGHVRERFESALGPQARINLERLFDLAQGPDVTRAPTLRHFAAVIDRAARRGGQDEGAAARGEAEGRVRLMTIHGAKGLEAPIVILVDADRRLSDRGTEVRLNPTDRSTGVVFGATREYREGFAGAEEVLEPDLLQDGCEQVRCAGEIEENNLLYVALTRARDRLYVLGAKSPAKDEELQTALSRLRHAAGRAGEEKISLADPEGWDRFPTGPDPAPATAAEASLPVHIWTPPPLRPRLQVESPSKLGAPPPVGADETVERLADPKAHGERVHLLLQLACAGGAVPSGEDAARSEAASVFNDPALGWIFRPEAEGGRGLSEAPFLLAKPRTGDGPEVRVTGFMDRVVLRPGRADIIDYKTNRGVGNPERRTGLVEHYRPQLAAYREAAVVLWPGREVRTWLLFTEPGLAEELRLEEIQP